MRPLDIVCLPKLMRHSHGRPAVRIGIIDGPIFFSHPELASENIQEIPNKFSGRCSDTQSAACLHGTLVAGILFAKRSSLAPAICPNCTLLVRPIFGEADRANEDSPNASPDELAEAIIDCVDAGARVINLSSSLARPYFKNDCKLEHALDYAAAHGVILVAAAGNHGIIGSSTITQHSSVIPVVACNLDGRPLDTSNLGNSIGRRGLMAPGVNITSLGISGGPLNFSGTSASAPFVTGTIALLLSEFPAATANLIKLAIMQTSLSRRPTVVPPLLNAWSAYQAMTATGSGGMN
jgi:subtilisin family serine protease